MTDTFVAACCDQCGSDNSCLLLKTVDTNYGYPGTFSIVKCANCDLVYLSPRLADSVIDSYYPDEEYTCFHKTAQPTPLSADHPTLRAAVSANIRIHALCDVGCATGEFLWSARQTGIEVFGIEPSEYARTVANQLLEGEIVFRSFEEANWQPDFFDAVTMWHVLEHVQSPTETLTEIHRILRAPGILSVAVPNFDSFERRLFGKNWIALDAPRHNYHFTISSLTRLLEGCGFSLLCIEQNPGAVSLASNILRAGRFLFGPVRPQPVDRSDGSLTRQSRDEIGAVNQRQLQMDESAKATVRTALTRVVYPVSWLVSRLGQGPELMVHAIKR